MSEQRKTPRKFAHEILGMIAVSALAAAVLFVLLTAVAGKAVEEYCFQNDILMSEFDWLTVDRWIFGVGGGIAVVVFSTLFLLLLARHMAYIRTIIQGIDALGRGEDCTLPLEGKNELTALAASIHDMSAAQRQLREQEEAMYREKEQLIRTLSHDIRTPLTSILAYSEYLGGTELPWQEQQAHLQLIGKKAAQIKDLTDILLDGSKRKLEHFEDIHLLMQQLAAEFEEGLEGQFTVCTALSGCAIREGDVDVQELRRIFDNLSSNIQKYADPQDPVELEISTEERSVVIRQKNGVFQKDTAAESHGLGLLSIRRIAQFYHGRVAVECSAEVFSISITLTIQ